MRCWSSQRWSRPERPCKALNIKPSLRTLKSRDFAFERRHCNPPPPADFFRRPYSNLAGPISHKGTWPVIKIDLGPFIFVTTCDILCPKPTAPNVNTHPIICPDFDFAFFWSQMGFPLPILRLFFSLVFDFTSEAHPKIDPSH